MYANELLIKMKDLSPVRFTRSLDVRFVNFVFSNNRYVHVVGIQSGNDEILASFPKNQKPPVYLQIVCVELQTSHSQLVQELQSEAEAYPRRTSTSTRTKYLKLFIVCAQSIDTISKNECHGLDINFCMITCVNSKNHRTKSIECAFAYNE